MKKLTSIIIVLFAINLVSSLTCDYSQITRTVSYGGIAEPFTLYCNNPGNSTIILYKTGDFFTSNQEFPLYFSSNSAKTIILTFNQFNLTMSGGLYSSDGVVIPINIKVGERPVEIVTSSCNIDIFPTIMTNIKIQQGETKTRNIQLSIPGCYNTSVIVNGVALQTDEKPIQTAELNLGTVQPGNSILIPIEINADGVSVGQYSDTLQLLLYDNLGKKINVPSISVSVLVSSGITPLSNFSFAQIPSCSLDSITLNLNNTYKMTCSIPNPNIQVRPVIDSKYVRGVSVIETSSQFVYEFRAITLGQSTIGAEFIYKFAPIGTPFTQEIKITPSGTYNPGSVNLNIDFYQNGVKKKKDELLSAKTIMLVVDNSTGNIVNPFEIYINGLKSNDTVLDLESSKSYDLRVTVGGYNDFVLTNLTAKKNQLEVILSPQKERYIQGDLLNVTSITDNLTIFLNDVVVTSPIYLSGGNNTIRISKEGYKTGTLSIIAESLPAISTCSPQFNEWKKGKEVICELTKSANWSVSLNNIKIASGVGSRLNFKINDIGPLSILSDNNGMYSTTIVNSGWKIFKWSYMKEKWYWYLGILAVMVVTVYVINKNKESTVGFS